MGASTIETFASPAAPRGGVTKVRHIAQQQQPSAIFAAMSVDLLDDRYFLINLILTVTMQMLGFAVSALCKSEQLFDFIGGLNFIACAVMTMVLKNSYDDRTIAIVTVVRFSPLPRRVPCLPSHQAQGRHTLRQCSRE